MKRIIMLFTFLIIILQVNFIYASSIADAINSSVGNPSVTSPETHENYSSNNINNSNSSKQRNIQEMDENFINNMRDIRTRSFKIVGGAVNIDGKIYYKNEDDTFKNGWIEEDGYWYYFEPYLIMSTLKDIDGNIYYFNERGQMETSKVLDLNGEKILIDADGKCSKGTKEAFIGSNDVDYSNVNFTIKGNVDGALHLYACPSYHIAGGALYIAQPSIYANGTAMVELNNKLNSYIISTLSAQIGFEIDKICNNTTNELSQFNISSYSINGVLDDVLYFIGKGVAYKHNKAGMGGTNLDVKIDFCINLLDGTINSYTTIDDVNLKSDSDNVQKVTIDISGWGGTGNAEMNMRSLKGALLGN